MCCVYTRINYVLLKRCTLFVFVRNQPARLVGTTFCHPPICIDQNTPCTSQCHSERHAVGENFIDFQKHNLFKFPQRRCTSKHANTSFVPTHAHRVTSIFERPGKPFIFSLLVYPVDSTVVLVNRYELYIGAHIQSSHVCCWTRLPSRCALWRKETRQQQNAQTLNFKFPFRNECARSSFRRSPHQMIILLALCICVGCEPYTVKREPPHNFQPGSQPEPHQHTPDRPTDRPTEPTGAPSTPLTHVIPNEQHPTPHIPISTI